MSSILVVESDPVFGAVLEDRLHVAGHDVELLTDRARTVEAATGAHADLLILDLAKETAAGFGQVAELRGQGETGDLPILVLAESTESTDRVAALRAGADDYLTKPCDLEELLLRAERLVGSRSAQPVLQGDLDNHPLWELVQFIQQAKKTGALILRTPAGTGRLRLHEGEIYAARWAKLPPDQALLAVFGMKQGRFRFVAEEAGEGAAGAGLNAYEVLMRAAWIEDELSKRLEYLPVTGTPLHATDVEPPAPDDDSNLVGLPFREVVERVRQSDDVRLFDLITDLPIAPQTVRLTVAWLVEHGVLITPEDAQSFPTTSEIASTMMFDMTLGELLTSARAAGMGTSALPFLVLAENGVWPALIQLLRSAPGFQRNERLRDFVEQLELRNGGSVAFPHELGKLSFHVQKLSAEMRPKIEPIVTVCAGVLLWLDDADDQDTVRAVIDRLEKVKGASSGLIVANKAATVPLVSSLAAGTERWRVSAHAPQSLLGLLRLMQPVTRR